MLTTIHIFKPDGTCHKSIENPHSWSLDKLNSQVLTVVYALDGPPNKVEVVAFSADDSKELTTEEYEYKKYGQITTSLPFFISEITE
jgi:hypothetical protein